MAMTEQLGQEVIRNLQEIPQYPKTYSIKQQLDEHIADEGRATIVFRFNSQPIYDNQVKLMQMRRKSVGTTRRQKAGQAFPSVV